MPEPLIIDEIYVGGGFAPASGSEWRELRHPATEELRARVRLAGRADVARAVSAARAAQPILAESSPAQRAAWLRALAEAVLARREELVETDIEEFGIPRRFSRKRTEFAAQAFSGALEALERLDLESRVGDSLMIWEARGVAGAFSSWNGVYEDICAKTAYALAAGCAVVVRASPRGAGQARLLAECLDRAGLPAGAFNLLIGGSEAGRALVAHPRVPHLFFTGSAATGRRVLRAASARIKPCTLELGGQAPVMVLPDADLETAVPAIVASFVRLNGQLCVAGRRLLAPPALMPELRERLRHRIESVQKLGDPQDPATFVGPLVDRAQFELVRGHIRQALSRGAELVTGGPGRPPGLDRGYYLAPTVLDRVSRSMSLARQEVFGPVLGLTACRDETEALKRANDSPYGLAAYVYTRDPDRARRLARKLEAGVVYLNGAFPAPGLPFGGAKQSGLGREGGLEGLKAYLEPKVAAGAWPEEGD